MKGHPSVADIVDHRLCVDVGGAGAGDGHQLLATQRILGVLGMFVFKTEATQTRSMRRRVFISSRVWICLRFNKDSKGT